jgi:hypothetical protein
MSMTHDDRDFVGTGSIAGNIMSVRTLAFGVILVGSTVSGTYVEPGTVVVGQLHVGATGGPGAYTVNKSQAVPLTTLAGTHPPSPSASEDANV